MDTGGVAAGGPRAKPRVIVAGNSKGGTGKSTVAVHLAIALLHKGYEVGVLDLDIEQGTITRYLANRRSWRSLDPLIATEAARQFPMPRQPEPASADAHRHLGDEASMRLAVGQLLAGLSDCDFVLIDTPGSPTPLSRIGHEFADVLVTPVNDSFVDIDVLAEIDTVSRTVVAPSRYSRMVMDENDGHVAQGRVPLDWVVVRNRLPHVYSHNRRDIDQLMAKLAGRLGFREAPGLSERVAFREHFQTGLTALDLVEMAEDRAKRAALLAAQDEIGLMTESIVRSARLVLPAGMVGA